LPFFQEIGIVTQEKPMKELHNVPAAIEIAGQPQATLDAKRRDLDCFLACYQQLYGHDRPEEWFVSVPKAFMKHLRRGCFAQASLVRIYATVRHFARWLDRKLPGLFPLGYPTDGVKPPAVPMTEWKGLTRRAMALRARVLSPNHPNVDRVRQNYLALLRATDRHVKADQ
jgi:site-specific recombinase XerC